MMEKILALLDIGLRHFTFQRAIAFSISVYALSYYFLGWRGIVAVILVTLGLVAAV